MNLGRTLTAAAAVWLLCVARPAAQSSAVVVGIVRDETGGALPGVTVELKPTASPPVVTATDASGAFAFDHAPRGDAQLSFTLINFAPARRPIVVPASGT